MADDEKKSAKQEPTKDVEGNEGNENPDDEDEHTTRVGKFIQKYHTFLSSFVIGAAGLVATSIWQYRQSEVARRQAESQQKVAETQAANSWKIERAEILSKNLQTLSGQGPGNVEQRYGVLLSLTRGNILDPELAVSYALELGKDNPDYMRSVLANITEKDYARLSHAFVLSCEQKYGVARNIAACVGDKLAARSAAIAELITDEMMAAAAQGQPGPLVMLKDEHQVQMNAQRLSWLFTPALTSLYERRQWNEIAKLEKFSPGARLVASLVLAAARTGEFVTTEEAKKLEQFHADRRKWLTQYLFGPTCDGECKSKLLDIMVSAYEEAQGDYDVSLKTLLERPHAESGAAVARLHGRLLWCQIASEDLEPLRDHVLVPAAAEMLANERGKGTESARDTTVLDDVVGLLALAPDPPAANKTALAAWRGVMGELERPGSRLGRIFRERRATAARERLAPPPAMKKISFCGAAEVAAGGAERE